MKHPTQPPKRPSQLKPRLWRRIRSSAWTPFLAVLLGIALIQGFAFKVYYIPTRSMQPTLDVGDRLVVNKLPKAKASIEAGDVVAFEEPEGWGRERDHSVPRKLLGLVGEIVGFGPTNKVAVVKRVIATEGQTVECCDEDGHILVDGRSTPLSFEHADYPFSVGVIDCETKPISQRCFEPVVVPRAHLFLLGDNRTNSQDSLAACRVTGGEAGCVEPVDQGRVIGKVWVKIWPLS